MPRDLPGMGGTEGTGGHKSLCVTVHHCGDHGHSQLQLLLDTKEFFQGQTRCVGCSTCCIPHQSEPPALPPHPFGGKGSGTLINIIPLTSQGVFPGVREAVRPPTAETTGCGLFLETLMQLFRFQECVSELEQDFSVMIQP